MTLAWALKVTWILGVALVAAELARGRAAALRAALLAWALAAILALPLIEASMPRWPGPGPAPVSAAVAVKVTPEFNASAAGTLDWAQLVWMLGAALFLTRTAIGYALSLTRKPLVPMTVGVFHPSIRLPAGVEGWPTDLRRSVMLHERAHISRRDPLWNLVAQVARAIYWFHPLVWLALHRLRVERERACDDAVLMAGVRPSDYAGHLVAFARTPAHPSRKPELAMAARHLETRVEAVLAPLTVRNPVSLAQRAWLAAGCCGLLLPLAAFGAPSLSKRSFPMLRKFALPFLAAAAAVQSAEVSGRIYDASNATVPKAEVVLRNRETAAEFRAVTGDAGEYRVDSLPSGNYDLDVLKPGFARYQRRGIRLAASSNATVSSVLRLGEVQELVDVLAPGQARPQQRAPQRIRVGGEVRPVRMIHHVKPIYPDAARNEGREGNVMLKAVIGVDGSIINVAVMPGADADLATAAEQAVRQWRYEPTLLNGQPVETVTTVEVNFRLGAA